MVKVVNHKGNLMIEVDKERIAPAAYMTYIEGNAAYEDFKNAGYKIFSACLFVSDCGTNEACGLKLFKDNIWKSRDVYDFSSVYETAKKIVENSNEKVYIIFRVNLNVPTWWREENPEELTLLSNGKKYMQSIFSKKWMKDAKVFIQKLYEYLSNFAYADNIIGLHLAGMQTEEWLAMIDFYGGWADLSVPAQEAFKMYRMEKYGNVCDTALPTVKELEEWNFPSPTYTRNQKVVDYLTCFNEGFAKAIKELCSYAKKLSNGTLLIGVFYGYIGQLSCTQAHNALDMVLRDDNIDFFASPFPYEMRNKTQDWFYHSVMDSVRLQGKLWILEADVRTHKTKYLPDTNPELISSEKTREYLMHPAFKGPDTEEESMRVLLRAFSKILISKNAFWWFDMFGGWYKSEKIMKLLSKALAYYENAFEKESRNVSEIAVVLDEKSSYLVSRSYYRESVFGQFVRLGTIGAPYDIYLSTDLDCLNREKYKIVLRILPTDIEENKEIVRKSVIEYEGKRIIFENALTTEELIDCIKEGGVHIYSAGNIVYANSRFVSLTASRTGKVQLAMPKYSKLKAFTNGAELEGMEFSFDFEENQTELFELIKGSVTSPG